MTQTEGVLAAKSKIQKRDYFKYIRIFSYVVAFFCVISMAINLWHVGNDDLEFAQRSLEEFSAGLRFLLLSLILAVLSAIASGLRQRDLI